MAPAVQTAMPAAQWPRPRAAALPNRLRTIGCRHFNGHGWKAPLPEKRQVPDTVPLKRSSAQQEDDTAPT